MSSGNVSKPYLEAWLKRTRKQLSGSGRLSEISLILSEEGDLDQKGWRIKLQRILDAEEEPCFEILTRVDSVMARPAKSGGVPDTGDDLFQ